MSVPHHSIMPVLWAMLARLEPSWPREQNLLVARHQGTEAAKCSLGKQCPVFSTKIPCQDQQIIVCPACTEEQEEEGNCWIRRKTDWIMLQQGSWEALGEPMAHLSFSFKTVMPSTFGYWIHSKAWLLQLQNFEIWVDEELRDLPVLEATDSRVVPIIKTSDLVLSFSTSLLNEKKEKIKPKKKKSFDLDHLTELECTDICVKTHKNDPARAFYL